MAEKYLETRGTRWADELLQDTRYAVRTFRQKPGFVAITLLILALGIGATTVMFAVVNSVLLRPLAFPQPDRILVLHGFVKDFGELWGFSYPDFKEFEHATRTVRLAGWAESSGTISAPGEAEHVDGRQISADLFSVLGIAPSIGRGFRADEDRPGAAPVAMISYSLWQRRFASDPGMLGRQIVFDDKSYQIVGVAPPGLQLSGEADVFTPLAQGTDPRMQNRDARIIYVLGRLASGVSANEARAELALIGHRLAEEHPKSDAGLACAFIHFCSRWSAMCAVRFGSFWRRSGLCC